MPHTRLLIEQWLHIAPIGAECMCEKSMEKNTFAPTVRLHVWWARRPLTVSRAAILASLLPAYPEKSDSSPLAIFVRNKFASFDVYKSWFLKLIGIYGDPVAGRKLALWASDNNITLKQSPYPTFRDWATGIPGQLFLTWTESGYSPGRQVHPEHSQNLSHRQRHLVMKPTQLRSSRIQQAMTPMTLQTTKHYLRRLAPRSDDLPDTTPNSRSRLPPSPDAPHVPATPDTVPPQSTATADSPHDLHSSTTPASPQIHSSIARDASPRTADTCTSPMPRTHSTLCHSSSSETDRHNAMRNSPSVFSSKRAR